MGILAIFSTFGLLTACNPNDSREKEEVTEGDRNESSQSADPYIDAYGDTISLPRNPTFISLAPNLTETVFALGAGERLLARTDFCDYPPEVGSVESVGTLGSWGFERMIALEPDLVLMMTFDGSSKKEYDRLRDIGLRPVAFAEGDVRDIIATIDSIGRVVDTRQSAARLTGRMTARLDSLRRMQRVEQPVPTFIVIDQAPLMTVSGGFISSMVEAAGGRNVAAGNPVAYPRYNREALLTDRPEVIILPSLDSDGPERFRERYPEVSLTPAGAPGRIVSIPPNLIARPGPRILDGIFLIREALTAARSHRSPSD